MLGKINWEELKREFIKGEYKSLKDFAEKKSLNYDYVRQKAKKWNSEKLTKDSQTTHRFIEKIVEKESTKQTIEWEKETEAINLINDIVLDALRDKAQFKKHLVQRKEKTGNMDVGIDERQWVEEEEFTVVDTRRLKDLVTSLTANSGLKQTLSGFITAYQQQQLDMQKEALEVAKNKAGLNEDDSETGIIHMPSMDLEAYEKEKAKELEKRTKKNE